MTWQDEQELDRLLTTLMFVSVGGTMTLVLIVVVAVLAVSST